MQSKIIKSIGTSFVDKNMESQEDLRPKLLINDYKKGSKVLNTLVKELNNCDTFMFSVAFITMSGLMPILETLKSLEEKNIKGKILTTDYLNFSEPRALKKLLEFKNLEIRIFTKENFHTKGYIFKKKDNYTIIVGSSNLTQKALTSNKEWNLKITSLENGELVYDTLNEFETMWDNADILDKDWILEYELIYKEQKSIRKIQKSKKINIKKLTPNSMQKEAVISLDKLRKENKDKALLISATGTGKTYLSAFDVQNVKPKKLLFLVHREQILKQAMDSFKTVIGDGISMGILSGNKKEIDSDYLFSTIQMMSKDNVHTKFAPDHFEYIIVDETHKAGSSSYLKLMKYFKPKFLLGMTATPERTDGFNIYELFDYNIAYEIRLQQAMEEDLLCPFHYFGITDLIVDGKLIDDTTDFSKLVSDVRVDNIIDKINFYGYSGDRVKGLIFCSRKEEAKELSALFNKRGYQTVALCGDASEEQREYTINMLEQDSREGGLDYIFTVDIFNEGVDIPAVNQVVMLRPTESSIVFVQQLGRGLRKSPEKEFVVIIDFIGNYNKNFLIPIALSGNRTYNKDTIRKYVAEGNSIIPGCSTVNFDKISKERIYESINNTKFTSLILLKKEYANLKNKLGKIPMILDFYMNGAIDPLIILDYSNSYYNFLKKIEKEYSGALSEQEEKMLEFVSTQLSSGKRPHELHLLKMIIDKITINIDEFEKDLEDKFNIKNDSLTIEKSIDILKGGFISGSDKKKYSNCIFIESDSNVLKNTCEFNAALQNKEFVRLLNDVINYSLKIYEDNYSNRYNETNLSLYKKYSRKDVCRLLNWDSDESSVVYGYKIKHGTCPVFVTYHKSDDINGSTKYEDKFIDKNTFSWMTKNNRTFESKDVKEILSYKENGLDIHLFVKKEDGEGRDFYYLGKVEPILGKEKETKIENDKGKDLPIVNIHFKMKDTVQEDIYDYLIKQ